MTLTGARDAAADAIGNELAAGNPAMRVHKYAGVFDAAEIGRFYSVTPAVLVTALSSEVEGIKLAVYLLTKGSDPDPLALVDSIAGVLRHLPGSGWPLLEVVCRCLYDAAAGKQNARLWALAARWPHKASGEVPDSGGGPVALELRRLKDQAVALKSHPRAGVGEAAISRLVADGALPQVHVQAGKGEFHPAEGGVAKWTDVQKRLWSRRVFGLVDVPVTLDFLGRSEAEGEALAWEMLPDLTCRAESEGLSRELKVEQFQLPEGDFGDGAVCRVILSFKAQIGSEPQRVPAIKKAMAAPEGTRRL